jgi:hypothetical protein
VAAIALNVLLILWQVGTLASVFVVLSQIGTRQFWGNDILMLNAARALLTASICAFSILAIIRTTPRA